MQWSRLCFVKCHHAHIVQGCSVGKGGCLGASSCCSQPLRHIKPLLQSGNAGAHSAISYYSVHDLAQQSPLWQVSRSYCNSLYAPYTFWRNHRGINTAVFSLLLHCMNNHGKNLHSFNRVWECLNYKTHFHLIKRGKKPTKNIIIHVR